MDISYNGTQKIFYLSNTIKILWNWSLLDQQKQKLYNFLGFKKIMTILESNYSVCVSLIILKKQISHAYILIPILCRKLLNC